MKLTDEEKERIKTFFLELDPDQFVEDLITNYGLEEIFEIQSESELHLEKKTVTHSYETQFEVGENSDYLKFAA